MTEEIYSQLRECVDQYGTGFPATDSGVEIEILKMFFTEEEARMYLNLNPDMALVPAIAEKTGQLPVYVSTILTAMKAKGLVMGFGKEEMETYYVPSPFIPGFFEYNTFTMDSAMARICEQYFRGGFRQKIIFLRTIPVETSISSSSAVAPYNDIREIVKSKSRIMVSKCACMNQQLLQGRKFDQPIEVCFSFDDIADYFQESGHGRFVTKEAALDILNQCEKAGLVPNLSKGETVLALCNCGKACYHIDQLKMRPRPADDAEAAYFAKVDGDLCSACAICIDRCCMEAINIGSSDEAQVDLDRCIGCGICVITCPNKALWLQPKN